MNKLLLSYWSNQLSHVGTADLGGPTYILQCILASWGSSNLSFSLVRSMLQSSKTWALTLSSLNCSWSWVYPGSWIDIICMLWYRCGLCVPGYNLIFGLVGAGCSGLCFPIMFDYSCEWMLRVIFGCWWRWLVWAPASNDFDKSVFSSFYSNFYTERLNPGYPLKGNFNNDLLFYYKLFI